MQTQFAWGGQLWGADAGPSSDASPSADAAPGAADSACTNTPTGSNATYTCPRTDSRWAPEPPDRGRLDKLSANVQVQLRAPTGSRDEERESDSPRHLRGCLRRRR